MTRACTFVSSVSAPNFLMTRAIWPPTEWLGLSVSKGFWKIICRPAMVPLSRFSTGRLPSSRLPSTTWPSVAPSSPISTLAKVDLPQPDSPTIATVSASRGIEADLLVGLHRVGLAGEEERALLDLVVLGQVVDLQARRRPALSRLPLGPVAEPRIPVDLIDRMQREAWKSAPGTCTIGIGPASQRPATKKSQRGPKLQPGGR